MRIDFAELAADRRAMEEAGLIPKEVVIMITSREIK
jgi:hypothetical protein